MTRSKVGSFQLGTRTVAVFVEDESGHGHFNARSGEITIGLDQVRWSCVVGVAMHEALEFVFTDLWCRFEPAPNYGDSADSYFFAMSHPLFTEAVGRAGHFLAEVLPELSARYKKVKAKKK